jgi:exodeoxyribonuclease-3
MSRPENVLRVATVNVNGIRAAYKRGMADWLAGRDVDILCLQEVRAPDRIVRDLLDEQVWDVHHAEAADKGRAGVAVATRRDARDGSLLPVRRRDSIGHEHFETAGRWVETDHDLADGTTLTVVSAYVHSGEVGTPRQDDKYRFLDVMTERLPELARTREHVLVVGDLNVGHTELDIKNWKGNVKNAGFLPEERAYFDRFFGEHGYKDVARELAGPVPGPYTWWSYRGKAFDTDAGWRIDYHLVTPALAARATHARVERAATYADRWSDHAPVTVTFE